MKIQIFSGRNRKELEEEINLFIQDKQVVSIAQSESFGERHWHITITVVYEESF
ncbi:hypothetical protein [Natronincola ferrireducens]|uniref:Sporulation protein Cse60 n=1 Tax=Natronincola ferrireducens TaxID=393762 RepID=A0A1G8XII4_9FIRM|nr:hypothetical protein [Natronincola ferrireducens]SDJ90283.1 hypothetical protein SAMN05660472_00228 [Natronincola ferrireducens]